MKIDSIDIVPYELIFANEYKNSIMSIDSRKGWIIKISSDGEVGYGDASPLELFSSESSSQAKFGLEGFKLAIDLKQEITFEELEKLSEAHGESQPSVQFAIESAIYDLSSKLQQLTLRKLLNSSCLDRVKINYYRDQKIKPFDDMIIKIKIIDNNIFNQVEKINRILDDYKGKAKLRLDFNGSYDLPRAIRICKMIEDFPIDYIEQPLSKDNYEDMYELSLHTNIPIAVDEMATDRDSIYRILDYQCADVFVLKPMLIGGIRETEKIIKLIKSNDKRVNISSLLESNVGRLVYLQMCAAFQIKEECGVATSVFFTSDICDFPKVDKGEIALGSDYGIGTNEINI